MSLRGSLQEHLETAIWLLFVYHCVNFGLWSHWPVREARGLKCSGQAGIWKKIWKKEMLTKKKRKATRVQLTVLHGIYCWPQNFVNIKQFLKASALISCWRLNHLIWRAGFPTTAAQLFNHLKGWNFKGINFWVLLFIFYLW